MKYFFGIIIIILVTYISISLYNFYNKNNDKQEVLLNKNRTMQITSPEFEHQKQIPGKYTCDGENINPPLQFSGIPQQAKSLVLIVDDPDAPMGTWVHWIVYNIPPSITEIKENSILNGIEAKTSFGKTGYGGPCPPSGSHRYFFKLYALDNELQIPDPKKADKKIVEEHMQGHILDKAELIGIYKRK